MKAKIVLKSFPGHMGIPGHQGGSLPENAGSDKASDAKTSGSGKSGFGPVDGFMDSFAISKTFGTDAKWSGSEKTGFKIEADAHNGSSLVVDIPKSVIAKGNYPLITGVTTSIVHHGKTVASWEGMRPITMMAVRKVGRGDATIQWDTNERYGEYKYKLIEKVK